MKIVVIGGGFVGQLVQLAIPEARVLDWRKEAPKNHLETRMGPQYLWEPIPGVSNVAFTVTTLVDGKEPEPEAILKYKTKIGKQDDGGDWGLQFQYEMKGYNADMPVPRVEYNQQVRMVDLHGKQLGMADWKTVDYDLLINTIPLPSFLNLLIVGPEYKYPFKHDPIFMAKTMSKENPESGMVLNYISNPADPVYRRTLVQNGKHCWEFQESLQSIPGARKILPGKIHPHPENELIIAALATFDCFCFGRFATWRPDELGHNTWADIIKWKEEGGVIV